MESPRERILSSPIHYPYEKRHKCTGKCQLPWRAFIEEGRKAPYGVDSGGGLQEEVGKYPGNEGN
jgi:hypothetical protein